MNTFFEILAYIGGFCTVLSFAPQMVKIYKTRKISGLSKDMYMMYNFGLLCWFSYGVYIESWPLIILNFITFLFALPILIMIIYYGQGHKGTLSKTIRIFRKQLIRSIKKHKKNKS